MSEIEIETHRVCPFCKATLEVRRITPLQSEQLQAADALAKAAKATVNVVHEHDEYCCAQGMVAEEEEKRALAAYEKARGMK